MLGDPSRLLDGILSGTLLVAGLSIFFVSLAFVGLAWWMAVRMDVRDMPPIFARGLIGAMAALALTIGTWMAAAGTEATAGFPLGASSGGSAWLAWYVGAKAGAIDASLTMGLSWQLAHRTDSSVHVTLAWIASAVALVALGLAKVCGFLLVFVTLGALLG